MGNNDTLSTHVDGGSDPASCPRSETQPSNAGTPPDDPRELGNFKWDCFQAGNRVDASLLDEAIEATQLAVDSEPKHSDNAKLLIDLGARLGARFLLGHSLVDLDRAILALQGVLERLPDKDPESAYQLDELGEQLYSLFQRERRRIILDCAIVAGRCAVDLTINGHADEPHRLSNLGNSFLARFQHYRELDDIEQSIAAHRRTVELTPDDHPNKPIHENNFGVSLLSRFGHTGDLDDIEGSIAAHRRAVELTLEGHPHKPLFYGNVGNALSSRFARNGDLDDIGQTIAAQRRAVDLLPDDDPTKPPFYSNLGGSLNARFLLNGDLDDNEQSIAAHRCAVELTPDDHPDKPDRFSNLGNSWHSRFGRNGDLDDSERSIAAHLRAVELTPDGHPNKSTYHNNLGIIFIARFRRNGNLDDLKRSIAEHRRVVELTPEFHPDMPHNCHNLGVSLSAKFERQPTQLNFNMAVQAYMDATKRPLGKSATRLSSALNCLGLHASHPAFSSTSSLLLAHSHVISILPEIVWLGYDIHQRFAESAKLAELVNAAVSTAIAAGSLRQAVEWLDSGRSLIWSQVLSLRTPLDELREAHPKLAESLQNIQQQLQQSAPVSFHFEGPSLSDAPGMTFNPDRDHHRRLASSYDSLLKRIRDCVGFEDFLRPQRLEALVPPSNLLSGPVVFINVDSQSCDALLLSPRGEIAPVMLPDLSYERAYELRRLWMTHAIGDRDRARSPIPLGVRKGSLKSLKFILKYIWNWIVEPVLQALDLTGLVQDSPLPHVTWCPTGPLMQLPLHAAGLYDEPDGPRVYNSVVSSYTPSLSAVRRSCVEAVDARLKRDVLIVTQPATPGRAPLPGTKHEGECLKETLKTLGIVSEWLDDSAATVHDDRGDLTQSAFALFDGLLSLSDLMGTMAKNAEIAFLSACQTAEGDEKTPEESAHLAAGMLAVGFKGVVATMWSIKDADAPIVVEAFYKELLSLRGSGAVDRGSTGAAYALHEATKVLRENVGEHNFIRWMPFVHFGV